METIINRVAESGIVTLDLSGFLPGCEIAVFDLKPFLFREMILREKDYRTALTTVDWEQYRGKAVAVMCSADAIIPVWAYMLAASSLEPVAHSIYFGTTEELKKYLIQTRIGTIDLADYTDKRVVVKGCGDIEIPEAAYVAVTARYSISRKHPVSSYWYYQPVPAVRFPGI